MEVAIQLPGLGNSLHTGLASCPASNVGGDCPAVSRSLQTLEEPDDGAHYQERSKEQGDPSELVMKPLST